MIKSRSSAVEILDMFSQIAPYINNMVTEDIGITVIKEGVRIAYVPARTLNFGNKVGEPVQKNSISSKCLETGRRIIQIVSGEKSINGVPYVACAMPVTENDSVVGCITTTQVIDKQEKIMTVVNQLASSAQELTAGMEELAAGAQTVTDASHELETLGKELV